MDHQDNPAGRPAVGKILSRDEKDQMLVFHVDRCRKQQDSVTELKAALEEPKQDLKDGQDLLKKYFDEAKADLGRDYPRSYIEGLIADSRAKVRDLVAEEVQRAHDKQVLSQPVFGLQAELFPGEETPTAARDEMQWKAEGFLRGLRGDIREIQKGDPPAFHQAIIAGFRSGQDETRETVGRAMELIQRQGQPDAGAEAKNLNAPEPGTPEAADAERKSIARAKESLENLGGGGDGDGPEQPVSLTPSFEGQEPLPETAGEPFEAPPAELAKQTTRRTLKDAKAGRTTGQAAAA